MIDKFVHSMADAMAGVADGSTILLGGFGDVGIPTSQSQAAAMAARSSSFSRWGGCAS
jgi:acyl CoA:acetate/3-ketoacid CoA transferase alpha subunit